jgi:hypothetical protein
MISKLGSTPITRELRLIVAQSMEADLVSSMKQLAREGVKVFVIRTNWRTD